MKANVRRGVDRNLVAFRRILERNGLWFLTVHNRQIVRYAHVPKEEPVEKLLEEYEAGEGAE